MTFEIKHPTPRTDAEVIENTGCVYASFARKLERELIACGHEQLTCCNCGARRNDTKELTRKLGHLLNSGTFKCPMCGQDNNWRRIGRFITE